MRGTGLLFWKEKTEFLLPANLLSRQLVHSKLASAEQTLVMAEYLSAGRRKLHQNGSFSDRRFPKEPCLQTILFRSCPARPFTTDRGTPAQDGTGTMRCPLAGLMTSSLRGINRRLLLVGRDKLCPAFVYQPTATAETSQLHPSALLSFLKCGRKI